MNINGIILIGPPGSGKSMIGKEVAERLGMVYVSSGDVARELSKVDNVTKHNLSVGLMADEMKIRQAIYGKLYKVNASGREFVLDGFPRFMDQYIWLKQRFPKLLEYFIDVPVETCTMRLMARHRDDDTDSIIEDRMDWYKMNTLMMLSHMNLTRIISNNHSSMSVDDIVKDVNERVK